MRHRWAVRRALCAAITVCGVTVALPASAGATFDSLGEYRFGSPAFVATAHHGLVIGNVKAGWRMRVQATTPGREWGFGRIIGGDGFQKCGWVRFAESAPSRIGDGAGITGCDGGVAVDPGNAYNSYSGSGEQDGTPIGNFSCPAYLNISGYGSGWGVGETRTGGGELRYRYTTQDGQFAMVQDRTPLVGGNNWLFVPTWCARRPPVTYPEFYVDFAWQATVNNGYVAAEHGDGYWLAPNRTAIGSWERFVLVGGLTNRHMVHLRAVNNQYVAAEWGGGADVNVNRWEAREWERFFPVKLCCTGGPVIGPGDLFAFRTYSGYHYLVAEHAGSGKVEADRTAIGSWETFRAHFVAKPYPCLTCL
jgi:hypothetical protein